MRAEIKGMLNKTASLTPEVLRIVNDKGTEPPFSGKFLEKATRGTYLCRRCGLALFRADNQFISACGWPSFDDELPHAIKRVLDADGQRTEILCQRCDAHLGHVFAGEYHTVKNLRHCVNSLVIEFVENNTVQDTEEAILAAGCFWGVEYYFQKLPGVLKTEVGYTGGRLAKPTYQQVGSHTSGHLEAIRVLYDKDHLSYPDVIKYFFEIHDFTQTDGQGPDKGPQYLSAIFYYNDEQKAAAQEIIHLLQQKKYQVATQLYPVTAFWPAENYHQAYYSKKQQQPYCHTHRKLF